MKIADFTFDEAPTPGSPGGVPSPGPGGALDIVARLREIAARLPLRPAVVGEAGGLCYRELDALSDRIGRVLAGQGLAAETRVGVMLGREPAFIAALFGVLKAGCV